MSATVQLIRNETGTLLRREEGRAVFSVTAPDDLVVKVPLRPVSESARGGIKPFLHKHFPMAPHRALFREVNHDITIRIRSYQMGHASPIASTNGIMRTDHGLGLLMQRVGPATGGLGLTLDEFIAQDLLDTPALKALNDFSRAMFALGVVAPNVGPRNIVWGEQDGTWRPLIVDGFGDHSVTKLPSWIPFLRHYGLHRGMERTARDVGLRWSRRKKMFLRADSGALD